MEGDDRKDKSEVLLGDMDPAEVLWGNFTPPKLAPAKPEYTTKDLIEILDDSGSLFEIRQEELFGNRGDAGEAAEVQEPSATITSEHQDWSSDSVLCSLQESDEVCDRPFRGLKMVEERCNTEDIEERTSPGSSVSFETSSNEQPWPECLESEAESELWGNEDDSQMALQAREPSYDENFNSEQATGEKQLDTHILPWSDEDDDDEDEEKPKRRRLSNNVISNQEILEASENHGSQDGEPKSQESIEAPTTKMETSSTQTSELNSALSSFFVNLKFSTDGTVQLPLDSCENAHQTLSIKTEENYLVEATAATPVLIGSQSTEYILSEMDFVEILAELVGYFHVLTKVSDNVRAQFVEELEEYGGPELELNNKEINEFSQYFRQRLANLGDKLCEKLAKVEVRDFNFFKILDCVFNQLAHRSPPILLSENLIWQRLAAMLKPCRAVSAPSSKTFEHFLHHAMKPPGV